MAGARPNAPTPSGLSVEARDRSEVAERRHRLDVNTGHREPDAMALALNEIGRVTPRTTAPLVHDTYRRNRATGSFILVDEATDNTVAAGILPDDA
ncbi:hypothetical protein ACIBSV_07375 [Embleya sp. NPDC050154]|uniref:elongation factor 1-alpha C-terminal domain-related protein n=1 Tax=unclassified Embleya TaxID=2699296 RepID=UPI0037940A44